MGKVIVALTADWEGLNLRGIQDFIKIRKLIGQDIPFTHFICPGYFTKRYAPAKTTLKRIKKVIYPHDEIGLHIHPYRSLINDLKDVSFRHSPNFYKPNSFIKTIIPSFIAKRFHYFVSGRGVPISAYSEKELITIIEYVRKLLITRLNIPNICSFRAGGWIVNDMVFDVLEKAGLYIDSSAVPPDILNNGYSQKDPGKGQDDHGDNNGLFTEWLTELWGYQPVFKTFLHNALILKSHNFKAINRFSQPYFIKNILEMPTNAGMSDFASAEKTMRPVLEFGIKHILEYPEDNFFMNTGIHQEGLLNRKLSLLQFIQSLQPHEKEKIQFRTVSGSAEIFLDKSFSSPCSGV